MIVDARAQNVQWVGGSGTLGACSPGNFLNFKRSEIDSVAFWTLFYHGKPKGKCNCSCIIKKSTVAKNQQLPCNRVR